MHFYKSFSAFFRIASILPDHFGFFPEAVPNRVARSSISCTIGDDGICYTRSALCPSAHRSSHHPPRTSLQIHLHNPAATDNTAHMPAPRTICIRLYPFIGKKCYQQSHKCPISGIFQPFTPIVSLVLNQPAFPPPYNTGFQTPSAAKTTHKNIRTAPAAPRAARRKKPTTAHS